MDFLKNFSTKDNVKKMRRQAQIGKAQIAKDTSDKGLYSKSQKEF